MRRPVRSLAVGMLLLPLLSCGQSAVDIQSTGTPSASPTASGSVYGPHNNGDAEFAADLIAVNRQIVVISNIAQAKLISGAVEQKAQECGAEASEQNELAQNWLTAWGGLAEPRGNPPGKMSSAQTERLVEATGTRFDTEWRAAMVQTMQGLSQVAQAELDTGENPSARDLAETLRTQSTDEIAWLKQ